MSKPARTARRERLFRQQDECCHYCGGRMRLMELGGNQVQPADMVTLEHIVQKTEGGTYADDNTVAACAGCNVARPNGMAPERYMELRRLVLEEWPPCTPITALARKMIQRAAPQTLYKIAHGAEA